MTAKEIKRLNKAYIKSFNHLQKNFFIKRDSGLLLFVEYLKYLRDSAILTEGSNDSENSKLKIATLITTIAELNAYNQSKEYKQKAFHWNNFCELIKQNMEDWLKLDDPV
jgi:hypothetical protein